MKKFTQNMTESLIAIEAVSADVWGYAPVMATILRESDSPMHKAQSIVYGLAVMACGLARDNVQKYYGANNFDTGHYYHAARKVLHPSLVAEALEEQPSLGDSVRNIAEHIAEAYAEIVSPNYDMIGQRYLGFGYNGAVLELADIDALREKADRMGIRA